MVKLILTFLPCGWWPMWVLLAQRFKKSVSEDFVYLLVRENFSNVSHSTMDLCQVKRTKVLQSPAQYDQFSHPIENKFFVLFSFLVSLFGTSKYTLIRKSWFFLFYAGRSMQIDLFSFFFITIHQSPVESTITIHIVIFKYRIPNQ